jgi:hypothetical protein
MPGGQLPGPGRARQDGFAPRQERGPEGGHGWTLPDLAQAKQAGATDQQIEALATFGASEQIKRIDAQASVDKADVTLKHLLRPGAAATDEAAVLKAADALSQARGELFKLDITAQLKVREILGAEVLKKLHEAHPPRAAFRQGLRPGGACQAPGAGQRPPRGEQGPEAAPAPERGQLPAQGQNPGVTPPVPNPAT